MIGFVLTKKCLITKDKKYSIARPPSPWERDKRVRL